MAKITDKAVQVFTAAALGKIDKNDTPFKEASQAVAELAKNPNPQNRYEIAQLTAFTVQEIQNTSEQWLSQISDRKSVGLNEKVAFKVPQGGIRAYIQAKGATTPRSKVSHRYIELDTVEVSARPYVNYLELAAGKVDFSALAMSAANEMTNKKLQYIQSALHAAISQYQSPFYASGDGIIKTVIDPMIYHFRRVSNGGRPVILGDLEMVAKFNGISGFNGVDRPSGNTSDEILMNGFIGVYNGCNVVPIDNPVGINGITPMLDTNWLYIIPSGGAESPLKVLDQGGVQSLDQTNIDDFSYEMCLRQNFGAAFCVGTVPTIGAYQNVTP